LQLGAWAAQEKNLIKWSAMVAGKMQQKLFSFTEREWERGEYNCIGPKRLRFVHSFCQPQATGWPRHLVWDKLIFWLRLSFVCWWI